MKITKQDLSSLSYFELRELNHMVITELKRKKTIESLEKATTINVGDIISCNLDKDNAKYCIKKINRTTISAEHLVTKSLWNMPISSIIVIK